MGSIRQYILSIIAGGILCSVVHNITEKLTVSRAAIRMLTSIIMLIILISPIYRLQIPSFAAFSESYLNDAADYIQAGEMAAGNATAQIIKERTQAYILDKAQSLHATVEVEVILDDRQLQPQQVSLSGTVSPYAKQQLMYFIQSELGISRENQIWK